MGLLDILRGGAAQAPGSMDQPSGLSRLLDPTVALPLAAGLLGNQGNAANLGNGFALAAPAIQQQKLTAQMNRTGEWLRTQDPRYGEMLDNGFEPGEVYKLYLDDRQAQQRGQGTEESFYGNPIATQNADGTISYNQMGNRGTFRPIQLPEGQQFAPPTKRIDAGTEDLLVDQAGNVIARIPKDLAGAEREKVAGKDEGEALALYNSMSSKMPGLRHVVDRLETLADTATYTWAGRNWDEMRKQFGADPRAAAVARSEYTAIVDNQILPLLRDTFGAQFTVQEGESLRATLGDPNKSPAEKKAVLKSFIEQKERDIAALAQRTGQPVPVNPSPQDGVVDYSDYFGGQ